MTLPPFSAQSAYTRATAALTLAEEESLSTALDLGGYTPVGLITPAALTNAAITFQVSADGETFYPLCDGGNVPLSLAVSTAAARAYPLNPRDFLGWRYLKIETAEAEAADRVFQIVVRPV
ncbi:MAG: hypothetical protein HS103_07100 [Anaerolineales bacterium]|nr:hypothetical protein [Anaerolineales bacterium]